MPLNEDTIQNMLDKIEKNDKILDKNKSLIFEFDRYQQLHDYSLNRRYKYAIKLRMFAEEIDKPFDQAKKRDIEDLVLWIKNRDDINKTTKNDYKVILKRFYRWIGDGEYPDCVKWINSSYNDGKRKLPDKLLNEKDIKDLIKNCKNPRDKALISVLWETGARIGELQDLKVDDFEDHDYGLIVKISGKTGDRRVPIYESIPHINAWLNSHPCRDEKGAPLWVNIGNNRNGKKMQYRAINKMLKEVAERAGVDKPVNPHNFRHSRATLMANKYTEQSMCQHFGWIMGSDMVKKYVHMSGRDTFDEYFRWHGVEVDGDNEAEIKNFECPRCSTQVSTNQKYCHQCGIALSDEAREQMESDQKNIDHQYFEILKENPNIVDKINEISNFIDNINDSKIDLNEED